MQTTASSLIRNPPATFMPEPSMTSPVDGMGSPTTSPPPTYIGGVVLQRHHKSWTYISATVDHVEASGGLGLRIAAETNRISMVLEEVAGRLAIRPFAQPGNATLDARSGTVSILPAGSSFSAYAPEMRLLRHLVIDLHHGKLAGLVEEETGRRARLEARLMFADPELSNICNLIANECSEPERNGSLYADGLSLALLVALARIEKANDHEAAHGGLSPSQLRRAQGYILEKVSEGVSLKDLAELTKVSLAHFCRAFKVSTGKAPHQWLIQERIEQSKSILLERKLSIAEVAVALGFCDQAHFTRTFNRIVGTTPLVWQKR